MIVIVWIYYQVELKKLSTFNKHREDMCFRQIRHLSTCYNSEYTCERCTHGFLEKIKTRARTSFQKTFIAADFALSTGLFPLNWNTFTQTISIEPEEVQTNSFWYSGDALFHKWNYSTLRTFFGQKAYIRIKQRGKYLKMIPARHKHKLITVGFKTFDVYSFYIDNS